MVQLIICGQDHLKIKTMDNNKPSGLDLRRSLSLCSRLLYYKNIECFYDLASIVYSLSPLLEQTKRQEYKS